MILRPCVNFSGAFFRTCIGITSNSHQRKFMCLLRFSFATRVSHSVSFSVRCNYSSNDFGYICVTFLELLKIRNLVITWFWKNGGKQIHHTFTTTMRLVGIIYYNGLFLDSRSYLGLPPF